MVGEDWVYMLVRIKANPLNRIDLMGSRFTGVN
jgi:hypothetical protein